MAKQDGFGSSFGTLIALIGSAVGLGNLWRFPYLVGTNGGAAFIIIYLICVVFLCLPGMISEFVIGRRSQQDVYGAFKVLAPGTKWKYAGLVCVLGVTTVLSFYCVVGGWTIDYLIKAIGMKFSAADQGAFNTIFTSVSTSSTENTLYMLIFLLCTCAVVLLGVKNGIEKCNKVMMPVLFLLLIVIIVRSLTLPGSGEGMKFLFKPDWSKVTTNTVIAALGQGFFSLSLGCGTIITYASYSNKKDNLFKTSGLTALADTMVAILASIAIMPSVFSYGISPTQGPGLAFVTLPYVFANMPFGWMMGILFFFIMFIAAISSSISLLEVMVAYLIEEFKANRMKATLLSFAVVLILGALCALSQGALSGVHIFKKNIFDFFDFISANVLMTGGGLLAVTFVGWKLSKKDFRDEFTSSGKYNYHPWFLNTVLFLIKYLAPIGVALIMINGLI